MTASTRNDIVMVMNLFLLIFSTVAVFQMTDSKEEEVPSPRMANAKMFVIVVMLVSLFTFLNFAYERTNQCSRVRRHGRDSDANEDSDSEDHDDSTTSENTKKCRRRRNKNKKQ